MTACQTPVNVDTSESAERIIETVTIIDEAACAALEPEPFGVIDQETCEFVPQKITPADFDALPEWARTKINRDDRAYEEYCLNN